MNKKKILIIFGIILFFLFISNIYAKDITSFSNILYDNVKMDIDDTYMSCTDILGPLLTKIVKSGITLIQVVCALIAIVNGMLILLPAITAKDANELKKAEDKLIKLGIILVVVLIFRPLVRIIGSLLDFDISCIL